MSSSAMVSSYARRLFLVFLVSVGVRALTALPLQQPGYFDAYFHYVAGENLASGRGLTVDFAWNFLNIGIMVMILLRTRPRKGAAVAA